MAKLASSIYFFIITLIFAPVSRRAITLEPSFRRTFALDDPIEYQK